MPRVLILGGTTEARALAAACAGSPEVAGSPDVAASPDVAGSRGVPGSRGVAGSRGLPGVTTISSLAGRTADPIVPAGELRIGGFGGVPGLITYLRTEHIDAVVDATHPFADRMTRHAAEAATETGIPLLRLQRPGWTEQPGDRWLRVPTMTAAATEVSGRVFLTTGRQEIAAFTPRDDCWFLARSVEPPQPPMPRNMEVILDRGPFTLTGETTLLTTHRITMLVTKDSGGPDAKLTAARNVGLPVVMVSRPSMPNIPIATTVEAALAWVKDLP